MDLLFLNKNFEVCKLVDSFKSFSWTRKYFEPGNFTIEITIDDYLDIKANECKYIYCKDYTETGVIETTNYNSRIGSTTVTLTGRFLEKVLEDRVIKLTKTYSGTTETIARKMVNDYCINCDNPLFNGRLQLGTYKGLGESKVYQNTGDDIKTALYDLLKVDRLSYSIDYDYVEETLTFNVWQGLDRTENQDINSWATFSKNFENIQEDECSVDETRFKNFAYVAGQDQGENRVVVEVNQIKEGEDRKELYVDARDLQQDDDMTLNEYKAILRERGLEKLQENNKVEIVSFRVDPNSNLIYKTDYDLGDIVMYKNEELGIYIENRIVEISDVFDGVDEKIEIAFGDDYNIKKVIN